MAMAENATRSPPKQASSQELTGYRFFSLPLYMSLLHSLAFLCRLAFSTDVEPKKGVPSIAFPYFLVQLPSFLGSNSKFIGRSKSDWPMS